MVEISPISNWQQLYRWVLFTATLVGIPAGIVTFLDGWPLVVEFFKYVYLLLTLDISIPLGVLILGAALLLSAIPLVQRFSGKPRPPYFSYTVDYIFGTNWRWQWREYQGEYQVYNLVPICPICDHELRENVPGEQMLSCPNVGNCKWKWDHDLPHGSRLLTGTGELRAGVLREVERRVRSGEWRARVAL